MSYASNSAVYPDNSSSARFQAWGGLVSSSLAAMGLVQTSDTGQIAAWSGGSAPTAPGAANTVQGYEIWRFNDALQATVPVFIKIEYGSGNSASNPGLWLTVGSNSNGSGTLGGQLMTRYQASSCANSSSQTGTCVFSGDTNRVGVALFVNYPSAAQAFFIERTKNTDGSDSSLGVLVTQFNCANNRLIQFIPASGTVPSAIFNTNIMPPTGSGSSGSLGSDVAVYPHLHTKGGGYLNAGMSCVGYFNGDISAYSTFVLTMYGNSHTFYPLGLNYYLLQTARDGFSNVALAMRYE